MAWGNGILADSTTPVRLLGVSPLARQLVQDYPDNAVSYRVLSDAYDEIKKNALRTGDDHLVEQALVQAVAAAQRSLARTLTDSKHEAIWTSSRPGSPPSKPDGTR